MSAVCHSAWLANAVGAPIAFAQVREDPTIDLALLERLGRGLTAVMVASGGCNACALAASGRLGELAVVDRHASQLALTRLKLGMLQADSPRVRCQLLGHLEMAPAERQRILHERCSALSLDPLLLGEPERWSRSGLDHSGRYELLFAALRRALVTEELQTAFASVMSLQNLVALFGSEATAHRAVDFAQHFFDRTQHELQLDPECRGPFLSQMLRGTFSGARYRWLESETTRHLPTISFAHVGMQSYLTSLDEQSVDFVHLSNILDWLDEEQAQKTLQQARRVLRPGGFVVVRQLNSTVPVRELASDLLWLDGLSARLKQADRSFFYRELHVGQRG